MAYSVLVQTYLNRKEREWENLCACCGACCGAYDDPCIHLKKDFSNKYYCEIYNNRFGERQAESGEKFKCVPIKDIINTHWKNDHLCTYKKYLHII